MENIISNKINEKMDIRLQHSNMTIFDIMDRFEIIAKQVGIVINEFKNEWYHTVTRSNDTIETLDTFKKYANRLCVHSIGLGYNISCSIIVNSISPKEEVDFIDFENYITDLQWLEQQIENGNYLFMRYNISFKIEIEVKGKNGSIIQNVDFAELVNEYGYDVLTIKNKIDTKIFTKGIEIQQLGNKFLDVTNYKIITKGDIQNSYNLNNLSPIVISQEKQEILNNIIAENIDIEVLEDGNVNCGDGMHENYIRLKMINKIGSETIVVRYVFSYGDGCECEHFYLESLNKFQRLENENIIELNNSVVEVFGDQWFNTKTVRATTKFEKYCINFIKANPELCN